VLIVVTDTEKIE
jgi:chromosome segregation ATPase